MSDQVTAVGSESVAREEPVIEANRLSGAVRGAIDSLVAQRRDDGHWRFELEADCTIPAEYILMMHFVDEIDEHLEHRIARYLRRWQNEDGGWPLYSGGFSDVSCSVKAYYALKLVGDSPEAEHMRRARALILSRGGAARVNVFTRIALAQFAQVPWRAVPFMPVEALLFPSWFPVDLSKISYWSRTVTVPLLILYSYRMEAVNPRGIGVRELFLRAPEEEDSYFPVWSKTNRLFLLLDRIGRAVEPWIPRAIRRLATRRAEAWFTERLNGTDGLGGIFPAMVNAYEAMICLGYERDHPDRRQAAEALRGLLVIRADEAYCQPCLSPVWDTVLATLALQETGEDDATAAAERALDWLGERQVTEPIGDWRTKRPAVPAGGWAFQYNNPHYPDLDDTAAIGWAFTRAADSPERREILRRTADWLAGMQSKNGGFAAFDADNDYYYLNEIPFADHGALLDPPTEDVSARVLALLGRLQRSADARVRARCLAYLQASQRSDGPWYGRWGTNYIYGTWSVLSALEQAGVDMQQAWIRRAADWLEARQQSDGGWGEANDSYDDPALAGRAERSTAHHTAWALLGLMAAGRADTTAVRRGVNWLIEQQAEHGGWDESWFNAPGFPRVFYLRYYGYPLFFPLWALARYRNERTGLS